MFLLRSIRKAKWYKNLGVPWLSDVELQADALSDLTTSANCLSVWQVEDDFSNLNRVVAALSSKRNVLVNFDYALINQELLTSLEVKIKQSLGDTPDLDANAKWHWDIYELSVSTLVRIANFIHKSANIERVMPNDVAKAISISLRANTFDLNKIDQKLLNRIKETPQ